MTEVEALLNTYADARDEGFYNDPAGPAYVGANGRRLMLRETPEGLYVGGVLITDPGEADAFALQIAAWAGDRDSTGSAPNPETPAGGPR